MLFCVLCVLCVLFNDLNQTREKIRAKDDCASSPSPSLCVCVFVISTVSCCRERKENEYKKSGEKTAMDFLSFLLLGEEKKTEK